MKVVTRGDFDGLVSTFLLTFVEKVTEIRFAHPKDVQDGLIPCTKEDIVVNMPYVKDCGLWFDHHISEEEKVEKIGGFKGKFEMAPSTARVIYNYYKHSDFDKYKDLLEAADKLDSAQLSKEDVLNPQNWILLGLTIDPRTGLGPDFQKYFRWLVEYIKEVPLKKILEHKEVKKRTNRVLKEQQEFLKILQKHTKLDSKVAVTDLRGLKNVPVGNRFLVFALYPDCNVEARLFDGIRGRTIVACGRSIFNRTCKVNVGKLLAKYGGGGHTGAATCQLEGENVENSIKEIVKTLKDNKPV